ncbi:MAG: ComEC/Rec2 family competence protein, partial [Vicinamibacterales bacterium]
MRLALSFPVLGLLVGAAVGLQWPDLPPALLVALLCGWAILALHAARVANSAWLAVCAVGVFAVGGVALASNAWHRAWRPTLRLVFESAAHETRLEATRTGRVVPEDDSVPMVVVGVLRSDGSVAPSGSVSLSIDVEWAGRVADRGARDDPAANPVTGGVQLTVLGTLAREHVGEWRAGRRIRTTTDLRRVARYLDPGVPNQERVLARRGVSLVGTVKSGALVDVLELGSPVDELAARIRAYTRAAIVDSVNTWSPRAGAIVTAIVIGDRTGLDDDIERRLQESGTYHVIAISGGNIAILAGLTLAAFKFAGLLGRAAMLTSAGGLVAYGFIVGGGASVDRAVLMAVVYFVGRAFDLRGPPFQALALVAGILVLKDPLSVADPASLLTFGATAAIVATSPLVAKIRAPVGVGPALSMLVASASTEVLLLPVSAALFSRVTFAGLALNFGAIPLMAVAQLAGMAVVPLHAVWPFAARGVGWLAFVGAEGLVRTASLVSFAPWSTWRVPPPSIATIAVYYASVIAAWALWRRNAAIGAPFRRGDSHRQWHRFDQGQGRASTAAYARSAATAVALVAGLCVVASPAALLTPSGDGLLHVTFIDVGQGDAALVRFPHGASMLIDAGGLGGGSSFDIGDRVVAPVLRRAGVRRLGTLALTHGDADHIGGADAVMQEFRPWD